jgi:Na+/H+ antiporter NhaC
MLSEELALIQHSLYNTTSSDFFNHIRGMMPVTFPCFMGIIISMSWSVCTARNDWLFNNNDLLVTDYKTKFKPELS